MAPRSTDPKNNTVLVVDEEPAGLAELQEMLQGDGYFMVTALTGAAAKQIVEQRPTQITAILLEVALPDLDGMELLRWLKSQAPLSDVEVVLQSAALSPEELRRGLDFGAYYYLARPFDPPQVQAIVRAAVSACTLRRALAAKADEIEDAFGLLAEGTFSVRTPREAELLSAHLGSATNDPERGVAILELLINAIEHGSLEIGYDYKSQLLQDGQLAQEIERRLSLPEYSDRRVEVRVERVPGSFEIIITDEGPGFEPGRYFTVEESRLFDSHGRGILFASSLLDLKYLGSGNQVRMTVPRPG